MNYRPSKGFIFTILPLGTLVVSLGFGVLPDLEDFDARPIPGEIVFRNVKPGPSRTTPAIARSGAPFQWSLDWFGQTFENVMTWDHNPWKWRSREFGDHFWTLCESKNPDDQEKVRELRRLAEAWHQKLRLRFPELAVPMRNVPDERNGFLQWLDFCDRMEVGMRRGAASVSFPKEIEDYLNHKGAWNPEAAKAWLAQQKPLLDEVRAIGLLPEQSANGIPLDRWGFINARLVKGWADALMMESRLAAEHGDVATALESARAVRGLADHLGNVETPSLLAATVQTLLHLSLENRVLTDIIPSLPAGQVDPLPGENAINPTVSDPAEFARLMKGEWSVGTRYFLLPMLLDAGDPKSPPDGGELLDFYSMLFADVVARHEGTAISDLPELQWPEIPDSSHLSKSSGQAINTVFIGARAWRKGWDRSQSVSAMNQAAFAIMKGQPIPTDPVYGASYVWDEQNRRLSAPDTEAFRELKLTPITVPKLSR